jgi:hypothetical protein
MTRVSRLLLSKKKNSGLTRCRRRIQDKEEIDEQKSRQDSASKSVGRNKGLLTQKKSQPAQSVRRSGAKCRLQVGAGIVARENKSREKPMRDVSGKTRKLFGALAAKKNPCALEHHGSYCTGSRTKVIPASG